MIYDFSERNLLLRFAESRVCLNLKAINNCLIINENVMNMYGIKTIFLFFLFTGYEISEI